MSNEGEEVRLPLEGIRVLESCSVLSGPVTGRILADYGATVTKLEHPETGDVLRQTGIKHEGLGLINEIINRNKRSVGMYLGDPEAVELFVRMATKADVVIENFRPGTFAKWGLTYERLSQDNPGLILAHVSGFGQDGPYAQRAAYGTIAESMSGFAHLVGPIGGEPTLGPFGLADHVAAGAATIGILMALRSRDHNGGIGQEVDATLLGPMLSVFAGAVAWYQHTGFEMGRVGSRSKNGAPRNVYRCADDKWVSLAAQNTLLAAKAVRWAGRDDLADAEWFSSSAERAERGLVDKAVADKIATLDRDVVLEECISLGIPVGPVNSPKDIALDENLRSDRLLVEFDHPTLGPFLMPGWPAKLSDTTAPVVRSPAPSIGEHTDEVLAELGIDPDEVAGMRERGVLR